MGRPVTSTVAVLLLLTFALSTCLYFSNLYLHGSRLLRQVPAEQNNTEAREILVQNNPANPQSSPVKDVHPGSSRDDKCSIPVESRFDCARDRPVGQRECEDRGCCYVPLLNLGGPPWCFYPTSYPGYKMSAFTPTQRGQAANLTRDSPSYLPKDVAALHLEVTQETAACFHLTVSVKPISNQ